MEHRASIRFLLTAEKEYERATALKPKSKLHPNGRNNQLKYKFGITTDDYNKLLLEQNSCCAICRNPFTGKWNDRTAPVVDHNHSTNEVRGLLCQSCNKGIGHFRENLQSLKYAYEYLKVFQE